MISGFDFGTSNCALGILPAGQQTVSLLPLEQGKAFLPSALYALSRELISEYVGLHITDASTRQDFIERRKSNLAQARRIRQEEGFAADEQSLFFGRQAFQQYFDWPEDGYFVKSPKSFLGASGLQAPQLAFFEDIVSAMMQHVKRRADQQAGAEITHTVIGRPVNFQGLNASESNQQALDILSVAARRAGFKEVEFLYEPIAAGLYYEQALQQNQTVLVVDVGGGTTDCALVRMGPDYCHKDNREADFLGHSGERVGGNDLDIQLAAHQLLPLFGSESLMKTGKPVPKQAFFNAVATNDVSAQTTFNSLETGLYLDQLVRDNAEPDLIRRFVRLREERQNHHLVRSAEQAKIALSDNDQTLVDLAYAEAALAHDISRDAYAEAVERPVDKMVALMDEALAQGGCQPDCIYVTGGTAQSPVVRAAIERKLGNIPVVDGDHFGSVAAGLTVWANRIYG